MPNLPEWLTAPVILSITSVCIALLLPEWRRWRDRRDALKGYVTLALLTHRFTNSVFDHVLRGAVMGDVSTDFIICRKSIEAVDLKQVRPAELAEQFLEIAHCLERANQAICSQLDRGTAEHFQMRSIAAMAVLLRHKHRFMNEVKIQAIADEKMRPSEPPDITCGNEEGRHPEG